MYKYSRVYDEACSEARDIINGWMAEKLRDGLQDDDDDDSYRWHEDTGAFIEKFLSTKKQNRAVDDEAEIDFYGEDEAKSVNQWLDSVHTKLNSIRLSEYETKERKKKPVVAKDPRLAMEVRQQKVREARAKREEEMKIKLKKNLEKKQRDVIAREIVKKEALEKAQKEKIAEEAVQREMAKIRKQMFELKKKHELNNVPTTQNIHGACTSLSLSTSTSNVIHQPIAQVLHPKLKDNFERNVTRDEVLTENIKQLETFQKQKLLRKCVHQWIRIVLSKRAALGKAKALADWHLVLRTWSAWRKYYFEQIALKEAHSHEHHLKQMRLHNHVASMTHRRSILKKCFVGWKKIIKAEQYSKELLREQEATKKKMDDLLSAVSTKALSIKDDLVLQAVEDIDSEVNIICQAEVTKKKDRKDAVPVKRTAPKHAWQVRRSDVEKLTLKQIENMGKSNVQDVTKIKQLKAGSPRSTVYGNRMEASKQVITQQREMISQQKQVIEEQQRLLMDKDSSSNVESNAAISSSVNSAEVSIVKTFQPPKRPKSLLAMEKRAEERLRRKEDLQEKKRQAEKDRIEKLIQEEEEQKKIEEEEKKRKQDERRRLKQLEIEKENERKAFIAKMQQLRKKAEEHYKLHLLRKYGIRPWVKLKQLHDGKMEVARHHYQSKLCHNVMMSWFVFQKNDALEKQVAADHFFNRLLLRRCLQNWLKYGETMTILEKKADLHRNCALKVSYLRRWERFVTNERLAYFAKDELALEHNNRRLLRRVFRILYVHKQNVKRDELRNRRIAEMRKKVSQLLPDFAPVSSHDYS